MYQFLLLNEKSKGHRTSITQTQYIQLWQSQDPNSGFLSQMSGVFHSSLTPSPSLPDNHTWRGCPGPWRLMGREHCSSPDSLGLCLISRVRGNPSAPTIDQSHCSDPANTHQGSLGHSEGYYFLLIALPNLLSTGPTGDCFHLP